MGSELWIAWSDPLHYCQKHIWAILLNQNYLFLCLTFKSTFNQLGTLKFRENSFFKAPVCVHYYLSLLKPACQPALYCRNLFCAGKQPQNRLKRQCLPASLAELPTKAPPRQICCSQLTHRGGEAVAGAELRSTSQIRVQMHF